MMMDRADDVFQEQMELSGVVNVRSMRFYADYEVPNQVEIVYLETDVSDGLYLHVDFDTDQLFWSKSQPAVAHLTDYIEIQSPFSRDKYTVFMYWHMVNQSGYHDAIQFLTRADDMFSDMAYIQFMAEASQISCYEFGFYKK